MARFLLLAAFLVPMLATAQSVGSIEGRITLSDGRPGRGIRVGAMTAAEPNTPIAAETNVLASITETDSEGRYRLEGLPAGRYLVIAGFLDSPTYFPGADTPDKATAIMLSPGSRLRDLNFQVPGPAGFEVNGRVISPQGNSPTTMSVEMSGRGDALAVVPTSDGSFQFRRVPPGSYVLWLDVGTDARFNGQPAPLRITVADRDVSGLEFLIEPHVEVVGNTVLEGAGTLPQIGLRFAPYQGGYFRELDMLDGRSFQAQLVEGEYRVSWDIRAPGGYVVKSLTSGSTDLLTHPLKVSRGSPPEPIVITLSLSPRPPSSEPFASVVGTVVVEGAELRPYIEFAYAPYRTGYNRQITGTGDDYAALLSVEGEYRVSWTTLPPGYTLKSLTSGTTDLLTHPLVLNPASPPQPVVLTLSPSAPWAKISGGLTGMQNMPAVATTITLVPVPFGGTYSGLIANPQSAVRPDGLFDFPGVPPGLYAVRADAGWPLVPGTIDINVSDHGVRNIELAAAPAKEITGRVQLASLPAHELPLSFALTDDSGVFSISATMGLDGSFKVIFPEGEYGVSLNEPERMRDREIMYGSVDLMKDRATIRGSDREELRIRLIVPTTRVIGDSALVSRCVTCPAPPFPTLACMARIGDTVKLSIVIAKDGTVTDVRLISGHQLLRQAAVDAIRTWRFQPQIVDRGPVESSGTIAILFGYE